jgi:hypothetical protein
MASAEHEFLAGQIDSALKEFSATGLLGVTEAARRKFDYACRLRRDFSQSLVSQVCWSNVGGVSKDVRLLLHDSDAPIKLYLIPDSQPARLALDEVIASYRNRSETRPLLRGFRYLPIPTGFDADKEEARLWMAEELKRRMCSDLLFGVVFGQLTASDVRYFAAHGGPFGLKFAMLHHVTTTPTVAVDQIGRALGTKSKSSMREGLVMLTATGLLHQKPRAQPWFPTVKGRFLMDLIRRMHWEARSQSDWSAELRIILEHLDLAGARFVSLDEAHKIMTSPEYGRASLDVVLELLASAITAQMFGVDALAGVDLRKPQLYSDFDWQRFASNAFPDQPLTATDVGAPEDSSTDRKSRYGKRPKKMRKLGLFEAVAVHVVGSDGIDNADPSTEAAWRDIEDVGRRLSCPPKKDETIEQYADRLRELLAPFERTEYIDGAAVYMLRLIVDQYGNAQ